MSKKIPQSLARTLSPVMQIALLGADGAMDLARKQLQHKVSKKIRALPGTDNAYKADLRSKNRKLQTQVNALLRATGCETFEEAITQIRLWKRGR